MTFDKKIIIPAFIASPLPFRLIKRNEKDIWNPTIEEINNHTYDYVRLHRISGTIDIGLQKPYTMAVTFDGSFILPALKKYEEITIAGRRNQSIEFNLLRIDRDIGFLFDLSSCSFLPSFSHIKISTWQCPSADAWLNSPFDNEKSIGIDTGLNP